MSKAQADAVRLRALLLDIAMIGDRARTILANSAAPWSRPTPLPDLVSQLQAASDRTVIAVLDLCRPVGPSGAAAVLPVVSIAPRLWHCRQCHAVMDLDTALVGTCMAHDGPREACQLPPDIF